MSDQFPTYRAQMEYVCLGCGARHPIDELLYTCPSCGGVFLLEDTTFDKLKEHGGAYWRNLFDSRAATRNTALRGVFRFYELMAPVLEQEDILYLGEGNTPVVDGAPELQKKLNASFAFKNDGQNPSASFKDRGMACAYSYLRALVRKHGWDEVLTICASTGDTSAAAALYGAYVGHPIKTAVLLPQGKVTPQQLSQPLGSGATVLEVPGVFDDCMKVVEHLAEHYRVALLNSKNSWRILGQESYAYEVAQWFNWDLAGKVLFVPVGNAGNITAVMSGLLKMRRLGIISDLPRLFGVQSEHADPVWRYYSKPKAERVYNPVTVRPSVAQAAMIGNPVSFPRGEGARRRLRGCGRRIRRGSGDRTGHHGCDHPRQPAWAYRVHAGRRMPCRSAQGPRRGQGGRRRKGGARFDGARAQICGIPEYVFYRHVPAGIRRRARREPRQPAFAGGRCRREGAALR